MNWIRGLFAVLLIFFRLRSKRFKAMGLCERCGKGSPSTTRLDVIEPIRVCASCSDALSIPRRRLGSGRYANRSALVGAIAFVAGWFAVTGRISLVSGVVWGITGAIVGGLVAWLAFPELESS